MQTRPNILVLQGEDLGRHLGCYGDPAARTPHLDQLAREGCLYRNAFTHAPVCAPSRGGMVSGQYPYSLGIHPMRCRKNVPPPVFTEALREAGYFVNWTSKLDFNFEPRAGWRDEDTDWVTRPAPREPFFLYENLFPTHESCMFSTRPDWLGIPPESDDFPLIDPDRIPVPPYLPDLPELRRQLQQYYQAVAIIDHRVGQRLQWLEAQGLKENTLVVFLSDHGRGLPREKRWCYDAGIHLPLLLRWPGHIPAGGFEDKLIAWVDIAPTLLSLAGAQIPETFQGQIFLGEKAASARECVFAGRDRMDEVYDRVRAVRDTRWHYIRNFEPSLPWSQCQLFMENQEFMPAFREKARKGDLRGAESLFFAREKPEEELYDIDADPDCLNNLAEDPALLPILERMRARLSKHLREVGDLGEQSEEDLIETGLLDNMLADYQTRRLTCPRELVQGPFPFPSTQREAAARPHTNPSPIPPSDRKHP